MYLELFECKNLHFARFFQDVEYVVTEYGTAYLYGKSIRERCLALIEIAHPDFRTELFTLAKEYQYLSKSQPGYSFLSTYPEQLECYYTSKKSHRNVFIRPIKAADEDLLRTFFHKLSDHSVYLRYFRRLRSMSHQILLKYTDLDYSNDMALLALYPVQDKNVDDDFAITAPTPSSIGRGSNRQQQYEVVGIVQLIADHRDGIPDIAFQVRDDWQGEGLGSFLFGRLVDISNMSLFHYKQLKADVLSENRAMRKVFEKAGLPYITTSDFGVITYIFELPSPETTKL
jgi:RimJ/RimL family protein N-acetyltransferase